MVIKISNCYAAAENMTCIPREGIYFLSGEKLNYTDAQNKCTEYGGKLMNILTEEATIRGANVIAKSRIGKNKVMQAYVGLSDIKQEGRYLTVDGKFNCKTFYYNLMSIMKLFRHRRAFKLCSLPILGTWRTEK